jgi:hypothetical protein
MLSRLAIDFLRFPVIKYSMDLEYINRLKIDSNNKHCMIILPAIYNIN